MEMLRLPVVIHDVIGRSRGPRHNDKYNLGPACRLIAQLEIQSRDVLTA